MFRPQLHQCQVSSNCPFWWILRLTQLVTFWKDFFVYIGYENNVNYKFLLHHQTCSFSLHFSNTVPRNMWWGVDSHGHRTAVRIPWTKERRILWWLDLHLEHCFIRWQSSFSVILLFWAGGIIPGTMCWFCNCTRRYYIWIIYCLMVHSHCPTLTPRAMQIPTTCAQTEPNGNLHQFFSLWSVYRYR